MHLFEFNDLPGIPVSFRLTMREIMTLCNRGFRSFNQRAADAVKDYVREHGCQTVVELGAGIAPLTTLLAPCAASGELKARLVPCDLYPDEDAYRKLQEEYGDVVQPIYTPVDFSQPQDFGDNALAVLIGTFHHVPPEARAQTVEAITKSARHVMVFEPLRNTPISIALVFLAIYPALALPLFFLRTPGTWRRILWCWLIPVVPLMFVWDAVVSCLRQWSPRHWQRQLAAHAGTERPPRLDARIHSLVVSW